MTTPIDLVLSRVEHRPAAPGQYRANCPCCGGRNKSKLSIRETPDGAVLLNAFCGCAVGDVVSTMGLEMADLFPPRDRTGREPKRIARTLTTGQALELLDREATLVAVAAANLAHGKPLTVADRARLMQAAGRVAAIAREVSHA